MSSAFRASSILLALSLSFICPVFSQAQSAPSQATGALSPAPEIKNLATALESAMSEQEQERLLAQEKNLLNSSLVTALIELTDIRARKKDYALALKNSQLAVRIAERIKDRIGLGAAMNSLASIYGRQNRLSEALECFQKSLAIYEDLGDSRQKARALYHIGLVLENQRHFAKALEYYEESLAISEKVADKYFIATILNDIGYVHAAMGRGILGLEFYRKSRTLSEETNNRETLEKALNNIGIYYIDEGRYTEALEYLQKSLKLLEESGSDNKEGLAIKLLNIGLIYRRQGDLDLALAYAGKSLKIWEEIDDKFGLANIQNNIGVIYKSQGLYEQALEYFHKSLRLYDEKKIGGGVARCLNNIGDVYRLQGRHDQALESLQESLRLREKLSDRLGIVLTLNNLGQLYQDQARHTEALEISRRAAELAQEINAPEELWKAQERTGIALRALGRPMEARGYFLAAIDVIESVRRQVAGGGQQRQSFLENRLSPWLGMIALLVSQKEYAEALSFAEQSKARVLLDTLKEGRDGLRQSLAPEELQAEEEQRLRLVALNSELTSELRRNDPDQARVTELKTRLKKARLDFEALETSLYVAHPELKVRRGEASIIKAVELKDLLIDPSSALLEYVVADEETYLFVVTKAASRADAEVRVFTITIDRTELARQTEIFRAQLGRRDLGFRASSRKLYDMLLKPAQTLLRGKSNLIIAPDDKLWELPFQSLLDLDGRFVIERSAVSYVPSLTVLREMKAQADKHRAARRTELPPHSLLAIGNPAIGKETIERAALTLRNEKFDPLPEAEQEVKALARLYGGARSKVYIGAEAREDRLKAEAARATILHFATHGILNNASPMYSHLALARGDTNEDGLLEAWEVMQLNLKAELAVLSACETARGRFGAGEGMIGLSWAMFIAGAPSIVVSQWKVESASARDLMINFHRQALISKSRTSKAEALRQAALKIMKNPATSHPFYWAGFVVVGDSR